MHTLTRPHHAAQTYYPITRPAASGAAALRATTAPAPALPAPSAARQPAHGAVRPVQSSMPGATEAATHREPTAPYVEPEARTLPNARQRPST